MQEVNKQIHKKCQICQKSDVELMRCAKCKLVYYCSKGCQKQGWPSHKKICKDPNQSNQGEPIKKQSQKNKKKPGLGEFGKMELVGSGNFSTIFKTSSKLNGQVYAIKQIQKNKVQRMRKQADVFMEKHCLSKLKECEHVIKLYQTFQDQLNVYFQMQFPEKGELWEYSKSFGIISESLYKYFAASVVKALSVIHNQYNIVHRDLKPQNILLDQNYHIKLIDFGTAKDLDRPDIKGAGNGLKGRKPFEHYVGTPHYMAPQCIHNRASQKKSDIYSLGGVLYFLKVGSPPFQGGSQYLTFTKSLQNKLVCCSELFSQELQDLIGWMNEKQMDKRPDINEVMQHCYFKDIDFDNIPDYKYYQQQITIFEKDLQQLCMKLLNILERQKQPNLEKRKKMYNQQIQPLILEELDKAKQNDNLIKRVRIIELQCLTFLNLDDNTDISFTELYRRKKNQNITPEEDQNAIKQ